MGHQVAVVEQHPVAGALPLDVKGARSGRGKALLDGLRDRLDLPLARAAADQEVVGEIADRAQVEDPEVLGLAVEGGMDRTTDPVHGVGVG